MFLGNKVFPISFQIEQVAELVEETLQKKNWKAFERGEIKLILTPFYLFYYDAVFEENGKPTGKTERGRLALNAETSELSRELADSMPSEEELVTELPDSYPLIVRKPLFSRPEAEKIALLKTSSMVEADRKDIVLTGFSVVYYPIWLAFVTVAEETYQLEISAITGEVFGEEKVPEREKGFVEITRETLQELKKPGAWVKYSREIVDITGDKLSRSGQATETARVSTRLPDVMQRPYFWISLALILVLVALIIFLP